MGCYMNRKAADHWGLNWPPDIACMEPAPRGGGSVYVTWAEILERRRSRQSKRLAYIRSIAEPRTQPCYVWVFHNDCWIYRGWWCYVVTLRRRIAVNFQGFDEHLAMSLMTTIPAGVLPCAANFRAWMKAVVELFPRINCRREGSVIGWLTDGRTFTKRKKNRRDERKLT